MKIISKKEWIWVFIYTSIIALMLISPYLLGYLTQSQEYIFSGGILGIEDYYSYLAKTNQGAHGAWLFTLPYTSETQPGLPVYSFYLILGKIAGKEHLGQVIAFHTARIILSYVYIPTLYIFISEYISEIKPRRLALILITLGGGLGWVVLPLINENSLIAVPLEFYSPEAFSFLMAMTYPHLLLARSLMLGGLIAFIRGKYFLCGILLFLLSSLQPLAVVVVWFVITTTLGIRFVMARKQDWKLVFINYLPKSLIIILISFPLVLYIGYQFTYHPVFRQWNLQNNLVSPSPIYYGLAYGVYLLPAAYGLKILRISNKNLWLFTIAWLIVIPILLYLPFSVQRRSIEGFQIPLGILTVIGLYSSLYKYSRWLIPLLLFLTLPSTILLWVGCHTVVMQKKEPIFRHVSQLKAFEYLDRTSKPNSIVLSSFPTGNVLPAYAPMIAFIGHNVETINIAEKKVLVNDFFSGEMTENERRGFLMKNNIDYIIQGPNENESGTLDLSDDNFLNEEFDNGTYKIYKWLGGNNQQP
jgi:hypothetical protein